MLYYLHCTLFDMIAANFCEESCGSQQNVRKNSHKMLPAYGSCYISHLLRHVGQLKLPTLVLAETPTIS